MRQIPTASGNPSGSMARLGAALVVMGVVALGYSVLWQFGRAPGDAVVLPAPLALERAAAGAREVAVPRTTRATPTPLLTPIGLPPLVPSSTDTVPPAPTVTTPTPEAAAPLVAADAADRAQSAPPATGYAVRLVIRAINLDTEVKQAGIVTDAYGNLIWETLPFVAVHYGDLTSLIGAPGNAVIAGHVVTLRQGNVFRNLYQLDLEDQVQVWDDQQVEHDFRVVDVRLVSPSDTSVMAPTPDETLTLITCGGTFDPVKREFSDRLIVIARPLPPG